MTESSDDQGGAPWMSSFRLGDKGPRWCVSQPPYTQRMNRVALQKTLDQTNRGDRLNQDNEQKCDGSDASESGGSRISDLTHT